MVYTDAQIQDELNRSMPAATRARLGDVLYNIINSFNGLLTHLDTANVAGIGNSNSATYAVTLPAERSGAPDV